MFLAEEIVVVLMVLLIVTQWVLPLVLSRPTFPLFRRRPAKLRQAEAELEGAMLDLQIDDVESEALHLREAIRKKARAVEDAEAAKSAEPEGSAETNPIEKGSSHE